MAEDKYGEDGEVLEEYVLELRKEILEKGGEAFVKELPVIGKPRSKGDVWYIAIRLEDVSRIEDHGFLGVMTKGGKGFIKRIEAIPHTEIATGGKGFLLDGHGFIWFSGESVWDNKLEEIVRETQPYKDQERVKLFARAREEAEKAIEFQKEDEVEAGPVDDLPI